MNDHNRLLLLDIVEADRLRTPVWSSPPAFTIDNKVLALTAAEELVVLSHEAVFFIHKDLMEVG